MVMTRVLVANRGEIALRIMDGGRALSIDTVAVHTADDVDCAHMRRADAAVEVASYADVDALVDAATSTGCDALHPGYGFASENPELARRCAEAGITFVGPRPELLDLFGDKDAARRCAREAGVPTLAGSDGPVGPAQAREFFNDHGPMMLKAVDGGGGRGIRPVHQASEVDEAYERCASEARSAGGTGNIIAERLLPRAWHVEVQILGDRTGAVVHLGERDCSIQRRRQKIIEIAPSPWIGDAARAAVLEAATRLARSASYDNAGTVEFLVDADTGEVVFLEVNPRLQVEHPVTEETTGVDVVAAQLRIAAGETLASLGIGNAPTPSRTAIEVRVNAEIVHPDGHVSPSCGPRTRFQPPSGRGIRVDTHGYAGYPGNPRFDSLLAKVITTGPGTFEAVASRAGLALAEFDLDGPPTNIPLLREILQHPDFLAGAVHTGFVDERLPELVDEQSVGEAADASTVTAAMSGTVVEICAAPGQRVGAAEPVLVLEAMKMEHVISPGRQVDVQEITVSVGQTVQAGAVIAAVRDTGADERSDAGEHEVDLDEIRPDLVESIERHRIGLDEARPEAVHKRRKIGRRTARENIEDLCDPGSFAEYGALMIAAQRRRRSVDDLIENTPADGLVAGTGAINGRRCVVMSYDYTVLAGTQGMENHRKKDRMFELAERERMPVVIFAEGGGGRPGDTDTTKVAGLDEPAFHLLAKLSGTVPLVAVVSGRCFAGNAALAGCCDVIIATEDASLGMGGPAMIEGGGLGVHQPHEIGPMSVQTANGVVDVLVGDDAEAVACARRYLGYVQGAVEQWEAEDQRVLRHVVPENRVRAYDMRRVVDALADHDSVLELRSRFGVGIVTALARIEGKPVGVIANSPGHLGGAIDHDASEKAARFLQLCDSYGLPVVSLCDTPGFMVGPDSEKSATVRKFSRMFVAGANLGVPICAVVTRKGYGLGAMAMCGGSLRVPVSTVAWPTGEFGGMGLEGGVRLGYRNELNAIDDPEERNARYEQLVAEAYERGKALSTAAAFEIDDVIDPAETRAHLVRTLLATGEREAPARPKFVDTW
ncbi:carboxyl transferase domain-containing protein [Saccharopolyspora tripterygii]